jgi:hypothetical protein
LTVECDACSAEADFFIGGAFFCAACVEYYESLPVPTTEDMAEMELWHG